MNSNIPKSTTTKWPELQAHTYNMCIRLGIDLKLFHILVEQNGRSISAAELAKISGAETQFISENKKSEQILQNN
jgi:hypothetical protein